MSSPAVCPIRGHPDMYGLGIRTAVYLQWFGVLLVEYLDATLLADMRLLVLLTSAALFLALIIQLGSPSDQPLALAEISIVLLLAAGAYLIEIPVYLWRLLTCFHPHWDPKRVTRERSSPVYRFFSFGLLLAVSSFGIWFWTTKVPADGPGLACRQYGFMFSRMGFDVVALAALSALVYIVVIIWSAFALLAVTGCKINAWSRSKRRRRASRINRFCALQFKTFASASVASILVVAVELTTSWNLIGNVQYLTTAAQMIPLLVTVGFLCRAVFFWFARLEGGGDGDESDSDGETARVHTARSTSRTTVETTRVGGGGGGSWGVRPPPPARPRH